jgi:delta1-piperideine-2-carboxylate reductase
VHFRQPVRKVQDLIEAVLIRHGYSARSAVIIAANCTGTIRDATDSHGLLRVNAYIDSISVGYLNGDPSPRLEVVAPGFVTVDADNGVAQVALHDAREVLKERVRECGIAALAIRNSHHLGSLYPDIEEFANEGYLALAVSNSYGVVAPPGGRKGVYGTNPIAFAAPRLSGNPLVIDFATSTTSFGEVLMAEREHRLLAPNTGIDNCGVVTGEPGKIIQGGALSTFGGHKGASISLMIEILCAALVGCDFSYEVTRKSVPGANSARSGETIILIDPARGSCDQSPLAARVEQLLEAILSAGQERLPGARRTEMRLAAQECVEVNEGQWNALLSLLEA